jgi:hypothetical protein
MSTLIDVNVSAFQGLGQLSPAPDANGGPWMVLDTNSTLSLLSQPNVPPNPLSQPTTIDEHVASFWVTNPFASYVPISVLVLGIDGNLWYEFGPFGQPAPNYWTSRQLVDGPSFGNQQIQQFQGYQLGLVILIQFSCSTFGEICGLTNSSDQPGPGKNRLTRMWPQQRLKRRLLVKEVTRSTKRSK